MIYFGMLVNKYSNKCSVCGTVLNPTDGFVFKSNEEWFGVCRGLQCIKKACPENLDDYKKFMANLREENFNEEAVKRAEEAGLYSYQIDGVKWITSQKNCLLADDPGLGKTCQILMSLDLKQGALVVAPSHLVLNWKDEINRWRPDFKSYIVKNGKMFKYPDAGEVVIMTYGLIPDKFELPPKKRKNPNITDEDRKAMGQTVLIFDEVQALKNNKAIKSRRAREMMKISYKTIGATGTPILNREMELWNMCRAIGIEKIIFEDFARFLYLFGGYRGEYGYEFNGPKKETPKVLRKAMLRRKREEVNIQLPDKIYIEIKVELPDKSRRILDNAWDVYRSSNYYSDDEIPPFEFLSKEKEELAKSKIAVLKQVAEDLESQDIAPLVFSAHLAPINEISKRKGWKAITGVGTTSAQKHKIKDEFQDGKLKGLALSIKAAGTGLTLTRTHVSIFNDLDWVPANNVQAEGRTERIGQKKEKVIIYHLVADHPLERHIRKLIFKKMALAQAALDMAEETGEAPHENETEEDFKKRVESIQAKDRNSSREAILSRLEFWPTTNKKITKSRAKILEAVSDMLVLSRDDERIVRLLKFARLENQPELQCLEAILAPYEKEFPQGFKKSLLGGG